MSLGADMRKPSYDDGYSREASDSGTHISLPSPVTEVKLNLSVRHSDVKGKRKASGDNDVVAEQAVPELEPGLTSDLSDPRPHVPVDSNEISSNPKAPRRPPRNKSLLDSVKAHLAGNSGSSRSAVTSRSLQRGF